jgi:hypothetical protein
MMDMDMDVETDMNKTWTRPGQDMAMDFYWTGADSEQLYIQKVLQRVNGS